MSTSTTQQSRKRQPTRERGAVGKNGVKGTSAAAGSLRGCIICCKQKVYHTLVGKAVNHLQPLSLTANVSALSVQPQHTAVAVKNKR